MMMPAPTPEETFTKTRSAWPRPAPWRCSARAPRLASLSTSTSRPNASAIALRAFTPTHAGQDRGGHHDVVDQRCRQSDADVAQLVAVRAPDVVEGALEQGGRRGSGPRRCRARTRAVRARVRGSARSCRRRATPTWLCPKSTPATSPAPRARRTVVPRRPEPATVSTTERDASSRTMLDTVPGRQAGDPGELGLGHGLLGHVAQHVEHPVQVLGAQRRRGTGASSRRRRCRCPSLMSRT